MEGTSQKMPDIIIGLDVGKTSHYAWVIDTDCTKLHAGKVDQSEQALNRLFTKAQKHAGDDGHVTLVVDQPNNIGYFAIACAQACGIDCRYLTGTRMRHASLLAAGNSKTDPKDARIIAETALTMPQILLPVTHTDDLADRIKVLAGQQADLISMRTATINRIRSMLNAIHPGLEKLLTGDQITAGWVIAMFLHYSSPAAIKRVGARRLATFIHTHAPGTKNQDAKAHKVITAITAQTITVQNTDIKWQSIQTAYRMITTLNTDIRALDAQIEDIAKDTPTYQILLSMPGVGPKTAATWVATVGDLADFDSADKLASYAGICPVTRQSGTSIKGEHVNRSGNKKLKNALWYSAFASIKTHGRSKEYYQAKRAAGKRHNAAVMALARRRLNVMFAMVKNSEFYDDNRQAPPHRRTTTPATTPAAAPRKRQRSRTAPATPAHPTTANTPTHT